MASNGKTGGKKKRWFEAFHPVWCTPVQPPGSTHNSGLQVYVTRVPTRKKAKCKLAVAGK